MKREQLVGSVVFCLLIALGAFTRIGFHFYYPLPNFAPIAAISLFAGYFFRNRLVAIAIPLLAMLVSDSLIGGYEWKMMIIVYAAIILPVLFGRPLRQTLDIRQGRTAANLAATTTLVASSLTSSLIFFFATNFAWWPWSKMYSHDIGGLLRCYQQGLPFFRFTLAGDLVFGLLLFGTYALVLHFGLAGQPAKALPQAALENQPLAA